MWSLIEAGKLTPETELSGYFEDDATLVNVDSVLEEIKAVLQEEEARQANLLGTKGKL